MQKKVLRKKVREDDDLAELAKTTAELEAAAELAGTGSTDRGSRALREALAAKETANIAEKLAERTARWDHRSCQGEKFKLRNSQVYLDIQIPLPSVFHQHVEWELSVTTP